MTDDPEITIDRVDIADGWVCFQAGEKPPAPDQLALYLSHTMTNWLKRNSEFRVRTVLPMTVEGNTVAIHVWFD